MYVLQPETGGTLHLSVAPKMRAARARPDPRIRCRRPVAGASLSAYRYRPAPGPGAAGRKTATQQLPCGLGAPGTLRGRPQMRTRAERSPHLARIERGSIESPRVQGVGETQVANRHRGCMRSSQLIADCASRTAHAEQIAASALRSCCGSFAAEETRAGARGRERGRLTWCSTA